jgi:hypothetical protein
MRAAVWDCLTSVGPRFCLNSPLPDSDGRLTILGAFGLLVLKSPLVYIAKVRQLRSVAKDVYRVPKNIASTVEEINPLRNSMTHEPVHTAMCLPIY